VPIEITLPATGAVFGPGSAFHFNQTDVGPIPIDDRYEVTVVTADAAELKLGLGSLTTNIPHNVDGTWYVPKQQAFELAWFWERVLQQAIEGRASNLIVRQFHQTGVLVGQDSVPITYSPTASLFVHTNSLLNRTTTVPDTSQLDRIEDAVYQVFPHA